MRVPEGPILPHSNFGDPDCCGTLWPIVSETQSGYSDIMCNECEKVVRTVPTDEVQRVLDEMEASLEVASAQCPHCGAIHLSPGFSELFAFVCDACGRPVSLRR